MPTAHVRQLGLQPGIQLNPTIDQTDGYSQDNQDQVFAVAGRFKRGRIDKPFLVDRSNLQKKLGRNDSLRTSLLGEAYEQTAEALQRGAFQALVHRLVTSAAVVKWAVFNAALAAAPNNWTASNTEPTASYTLGIKPLNCFNDGLIFQIHADEKLDATPTQVPADVVTVWIIDPVSFEVLLKVTGSLDPAAKDEFNNSFFIVDVAATLSDEYVFKVATGATIPINSPAYGADVDGNDNIAEASLVCFTEGGTSYGNDEYDAAVVALKGADAGYDYIISGGSRAPALLTRLADLAYDTNRHLDIDVPGDLGPAAAKTWVDQLAIDSEHVRFLWAPIMADTPSGGGKFVFGTGGIHTGFSCRRNARRNAQGFAPKNYPIGGAAWPIDRTGMSQIYRPSEAELSLLAGAKIVPVLFETYNGGGKYVFTDVLTGRKVSTSYLKLQSVAEMKATIDQAATRQAKEWQLLPMSVFIKRMQDWLDIYLAGAQNAGWLVPSAKLDGRAFAHSVRKAVDRPADTVYIDYWTSFDGVVRQGFVTQTIVR